MLTPTRLKLRLVVYLSRKTAIVRRQGIATFTLRTEDMGRFRTPSLRNVAAKGPYMDDGSIGSLSDVMDAYAKGGRFPDAAQKDMTAQERADVIAFLESL